jgi:protein-S-isoprenylcysteine O-methyltransferase Ste14
MNKPTTDHPEVAIFPPVIPLVTLVLSIALQWLTPLGWLAMADPLVRMLCGAAIVAIGAFITVSGRQALVRSGTAVNPLHPTTALVTAGIFGWKRNPLYVGVSFALCGVALIFALDWLPLLLIPACLLMHFAVVRREERYLERKFGDEFRRYTSHVPRYVGFQTAED